MDRGTEKVENYRSMQVCCFKQTIKSDMNYVKKYLNV